MYEITVEKKPACIFFSVTISAFLLDRFRNGLFREVYGSKNDSTKLKILFLTVFEP